MLCIIYVIFFLVSSEPLNPNNINITSTSFCVSFEPPTDTDQNGPITSYTVTYQGELFNTTEYNTTVSVNTVVYPLTESSSVCISDLEEYNNYTVLIRANNGAGEGAAAVITVKTLGAGFCYLVELLTNLFTSASRVANSSWTHSDLLSSCRI